MKAPFVVRADYEKREYYVVNFDSGAVVSTYKYSNESSRGTAAGRADMQRRDLNDAWRKANG